MSDTTITKHEIDQVTIQLGRKPQDVVKVDARCFKSESIAHIAVIRCYPLRRDKTGKLKPWPNLFWLTCPNISRQVSELERVGIIKKIEARLAKDKALVSRLMHDHQRYIATRWATLSNQDQLAIENAGLKSLYQTRGIGGISHFTSLKCLHAHYAQHLVQGNCIGDILEQEYGVSRCNTKTERDGLAPSG